MPEAFWAHVAASSEATRRAAETATTSSSGADADHDAFVALYVIEGDPQWDFARAAGGLIVHTRPEAHLDSAPAPLPRLVILRGVNQFNNSENRLSDSWGGDSRTRFARSCDIPGIVARPAVHFRATEAVVAEDDHHGGIHHHEELPSSEKDDSGNVPSGTSSIGSGIGCGWSVFRTDRISRDEKLGATDVCTALAILRPRRYRLRKMDVRLCRAALRRRRRVQYATLSPAWARRSELFRLADAVWSFNENVSADRSSGGSSNVHYDDKANDASTTKKKRKKEMTYVAPLLETSVVRSTAAVAIQSLWRGYRVRDVAGASIAARIVRHRAATVMQRWWRVRLLSRRCLMLGQLRALLANTRGEAHLCLSEESVRRLATFNKATTSRASPVPESKIRYCFHLATGGVVGVMGQTDALYKRQSAVAEWTGISVDLITEAEATNKDNEFSPIYTRENVEPLLESFVAHTFGSDDEDEDDDDEGGGAAATSVPRSPERAESRSGAGVDRKRRLARARSRSDGYSGSTGSGPHLFHFSDSIEARRRVALLFLLTWDVYTMRGVELSVHPDLHTYRMRHARRLQSRKTSRATDNAAMASSSMLRADGREDSTTLHREETTTSTATAVATGMPGDERSVTFINNQQGRGLDAATRGGGMTSTAARDYGAGLGRSGSGMYCWRDGWLTPESAGAVADFEASMKDLTGLNRNISRIRADAVASPGVASTKDDLVRQRKEQALNLKEDLQRQRRAREEFDEREEQIRKAMINKVLTPSVIVRSPNTSSATFKHYMNDPPMLQMRARQLEKAELVRKKVLVESMQSSSQSRRLVRDRAIAQARADARNHVYSMRSVHSEAIAQRRHAEQLENSRRVAFRDWERRQLQDKMMNVAHAKELSSRLSSLGLSMQRAITNARRETMLLATASATRCQSEAERRVISMRRSMRSSYGLVRRPRRRMARSSSADRQLGSKSACGGRNVGFDIDDDDDDDGDGVGMEGMDCGSASSGEDVDGNGGGGDQDSCGGGGGTRGPARGRTAGATKSTTRGERMSWTTSSSASDRHHRDAHPAALSGRASAQPWHAPRRAHDGGKADNLGAAYQHDGVTKGAAMKKKSATTTTTTTTSRTSGEMRNSGFEIAVGIRTSQRTMCGDRRRASSGLGFSSSTTPPPISSMASPFGTRRHAVKMAKVMGTHDAERVRSDDTTSRPSPPSRLPLNCHRSPP